jgi:short-subunit dehydrogenase
MDTTSRRVARFHRRFGNPDQGAFLVTGASSGIGREMAVALARIYGYDVILVARRTNMLEELAKDLPTKVVLLPTDLQTAFATEQGILHFREQLVTALPSAKTLAGCVHMAGNSDLAVHGLTDKSPARNLDMLDLNCRGTLGTLQAITPLLAAHVAATSCRAVAVTPGALTAFPDACPTFATSSANKHYVRALTLSLRYEYELDGIDFACACPVAVKSEILCNTENKIAGLYSAFIPTSAEFSKNVLDDLAFGLPETNGRYFDWMATWHKHGPSWSTRRFFSWRVQSNSILLQRPIRLQPLREKMDI